MKQNVKLLFDRRNTVKKTGKGTIEILVYLSREERKWEAVGTADEQSWEVMANDRRILTKANVIAFDAWLRAQNNKTDYTINGYHKKVRKYTKILWRLEMISSDPYEYVKFPKGKNKERVPLIEPELVKIRQAGCSGRIERARDLFIFMAYTGLAYCDMSVFNFNTMTEEHTDYTYIDGSRLKTGSNFFTPILPPAEVIE